MLRPYISACVLGVDSDAGHFALARRHRDRGRPGGARAPRRRDPRVRLSTRGAWPAAPDPFPPRPRVLVLEWLDPPYVAGHWVPELIETAGGEDVAGVPGARSVTRSWRELSALAPDLVVVALCGFDVERARRELALITDRDARALLDRRVEFLDGNAYTSRPGPRLVDAAEILARLIQR